MNLGYYTCLGLAVIFGIITIFFTVLGEKAAYLISGFNSLTKEQRSLYDTNKMSKDQRNSMLIWTVIMVIGAVFSFFISQYVAIMAFIIWLIVFFKDVHMDAEIAFEKYKIK